MTKMKSRKKKSKNWTSRKISSSQRPQNPNSKNNIVDKTPKLDISSNDISNDKDEKPKKPE
jgi:hypothetical protein